MRRLILACIVVIALAGGAHAQRATLQLEGRPHAGVPFTLVMVVDGFDEAPAPIQPKLEIAGAQVTPSILKSEKRRPFESVPVPTSKTNMSPCPPGPVSPGPLPVLAT